MYRLTKARSQALALLAIAMLFCACKPRHDGSDLFAQGEGNRSTLKRFEAINKDVTAIFMHHSLSKFDLFSLIPEGRGNPLFRMMPHFEDNGIVQDTPNALNYLLFKDLFHKFSQQVMIMVKAQRKFDNKNGQAIALNDETYRILSTIYSGPAEGAGLRDLWVRIIGPSAIRDEEDFTNWQKFLQEYRSKGTADEYLTMATTTVLLHPAFLLNP
jgi:hypothetical protein